VRVLAVLPGARVLDLSYIPPDARPAIEQTENTLNRVQDYLASRRGLVWRTWSALLAKQESTSDWSRRQRIRLSLSDLHALLDRLAAGQSPALLPRLDATPVPNEERAGAQAFLPDWWQTEEDTTVRQHFAL